MTEALLLKRLVAMLSSMIPEPPAAQPTTPESRLVAKLVDTIVALVPTEANDIAELIRRLASWGIHAIETDPSVRETVKQKLIEFAMMVADEYSQ